MVARPWGGGEGEERRGLSSPLMAGSVLSSLECPPMLSTLTRTVVRVAR
jgi:hypothetical protein